MISSSTIYTEEVLNKFISYYLKNSKSMIVIYVCSLIILASSIVMFCLNSIFEGVLYLLCALFFGSYGLIIRFIMKKNNKKVQNNVDNYEFDVDNFNITSFNSKGEQIMTMKVYYRDLYKVAKSGEYAYLFINKATAFIVSQNNFENKEDFDKVINIATSQIKS